MQHLRCILLINLVLIASNGLIYAQEGEEYEYYNYEEPAPQEVHSVTEKAHKPAHLVTEKSHKAAHLVTEKAHKAAHSVTEKAHKAAHSVTEKAQKAHHSTRTHSHVKKSKATPAGGPVPAEYRHYSKINLTAMFARIAKKTRQPQKPDLFDWADHYTVYGKHKNEKGKPESFAGLVRSPKPGGNGGYGFKKLREEYQSKKQLKPLNRHTEMMLKALDEHTKRNGKNNQQDMVAQYIKANNPFGGIPKNMFDSNQYKSMGLAGVMNV